MNLVLVRVKSEHLTVCNGSVNANPVVELHNFTLIFKLMWSMLYGVLAELFSGMSVEAFVSILNRLNAR